ncbi:MAG: excinuclease ABC subunit A [Candidatus Dadabacteria bacterium]|nr:MAG: excinuclease ABC subunit A [Candidatus Dadabacteria bacterium]
MGRNSCIEVVGARENNLKNISIQIPHDTLTVITGRSGAGKSSLAFDTIHAEGYRRYVETFSPYTRQFFDKVKRPDADLIRNIRPSVAIKQRTRVRSSRATVGSMSGLNAKLAVFWANVSEPHCPKCGFKLDALSPDRVERIVGDLVRHNPDRTFVLCAPLQSDETFKGKLEQARQEGVVRFFDFTSGKAIYIEEMKPGHITEGWFYLVIDRFSSKGRSSKEWIESIKRAFNLGQGTCCLIECGKRHRNKGLKVLASYESKEANQKRCFYNGIYIRYFTERHSCPLQETHLPEKRPSLFNFNSPLGACRRCKGFGSVLIIDPDKCVPDGSLSIEQGAVQCWSSPSKRRLMRSLLNFCASHSIPTDIPWNNLPLSAREEIFFAKEKGYKGINHWFKSLEKKIYKTHVRVFISRYRSEVTCPECCGKRFDREVYHFRINGMAIADLLEMPAEQALKWFSELPDSLCFSRRIQELRSDIIATLSYLVDVGLGYLSLNRTASTLSGGETQRVNLASALGSRVVSSQFVLDEPTVGLHPRDTLRLLEAVRKLQRRGNTVLVVEHDLDCIFEADHIVEIGPGAGEKGGAICYEGEANRWKGVKLEIPDTLLGDFKGSSKCISVEGAYHRNLKGIRCHLPLNRFVVITGVSGSGKSTLLEEVLYGEYQKWRKGLESVLYGCDRVEDVVLVDQTPIAKNPRGNIATYSGIWGEVRDLLAESSEAVAKGLTKSSFSFNLKGGRCEECKGAGFVKEEMQFLSDVYIRCDSCLGSRFKDVVSGVRLRGRSVAEILDMSVSEASEFFADNKRITSLCRTLSAVGLGYIRLGHPLSELSGGESQRLKLVSFLMKKGRKNSLLLFDEPTTGLHFFDVMNLVRLFRELVNRGHTVVCVEHNLPLIYCADWMLELGPEGGEGGGRIIIEGNPRELLSSHSMMSTPTINSLRDFCNKLSKGGSCGRIVRKENVRREGSGVDRIEIRGAREHNLKGVDITLPLNRIVSITGVSGSGKSTLAYDIVYAEAQREYLQALAPYARHYIGTLKQPDIDSISGIAPSVAVSQYTNATKGLSTVGTLSECYNFLRLLFAKIGVQYCQKHPEARVEKLSARAISEELCRRFNGSVKVLAPIISNRKGFHKDVIERALASEIRLIRVDGRYGTPAQFISGLERNKSHTIEFVVAECNPTRVPVDVMYEAVDQALALSPHGIVVDIGGKDEIYSTERACTVCRRGYLPPDPEDFSFHSSRGACRGCGGKGIDARGKRCKSCGGARLKKKGLSVKISEKSIYDLASLKIEDLIVFLKSLSFNGRKEEIVKIINKELLFRLEALDRLGLGYLSLDRDCDTLARGELQRVRISTALGSPLTGVIYILDEPSIGLHPLDNMKVLKLLTKLKELGNHLFVIEHDLDTILRGDYIIEMGPGGGSYGGTVVFSGSQKKYRKEVELLLNKDLAAPKKALEQSVNSDSLIVMRGSCNNIKDIKIKVPLKRFVSVIGVSGAGKSSFVLGILAKALVEGKQKDGCYSTENATITSTCSIDGVCHITQKPIGKNSRSTPASYLGIWGEIRDVYAKLPEAKELGFRSSDFSFNAGKGRCSECGGLGEKKLEMSFLPSAFVTCPQCLGGRFTKLASGVRYKGLSISDVLNMTFDEARDFFSSHKRIRRAVDLACALGLGYLKLGQGSSTLSGGEAQRIRLAKEISKGRRGHTVYILEEPTVGLHRIDISRLVEALKTLVYHGNSVIVVENDLSLIAEADYLIEFGPEAGEKGGKVVFQGDFAMLEVSDSPWGSYLADRSANKNSSSRMNIQNK